MVMSHSTAVQGNHVPDLPSSQVGDVGEESGGASTAEQGLLKCSSSLKQIGKRCRGYDGRCKRICLQDGSFA